MTLDIHKDPEKLSSALKLIEGVIDVYYEYPGFWLIRTTKGQFDLGTANGCVGWDSPNDDSGETQETSIIGIVFAFHEYLKAYPEIEATKESYANSN